MLYMYLERISVPRDSRQGLDDVLASFADFNNDFEHQLGAGILSLWQDTGESVVRLHVARARRDLMGLTQSRNLSKDRGLQTS